MSGKSQINFTVEEAAKDLAKEKLAHGELSTELRETIHRIAYGQEISKREQLQRQLADLRDSKDSIRAAIREKEAELEEVEGKIRRVEERLDGMERREDKYEATLEMLEETLYAGGHVFEEHGQVLKAAKIGGKEAADVIAELQERNPSVPDRAFVQRMHADREWHGLDRESDSSSS
jgi:chromosome segregation ATPase